MLLLQLFMVQLANHIEH